MKNIILKQELKLQLFVLCLKYMGLKPKTHDKSAILQRPELPAIHVEQTSGPLLHSIHV